MASESQSNNRTRVGRRVRPTQRAIEADLQISGITTTLLDSTPSRTSSALSPRHTPVFSQSTAVLKQLSQQQQQQQNSLSMAPPCPADTAATGIGMEATRATPSPRQSDTAVAAAAATLMASQVAASEAAMADDECAGGALATAQQESSPTAKPQEYPNESASQPQNHRIKHELESQVDLFSAEDEITVLPAKCPKKARKTSASTKNARKGAQSQRKKSQAQTPAKPKPTFETADPELHHTRLPVYPWEAPRPTDFLNLSEQRKAWKADADDYQGEIDSDPELDDWNEFSVIRSDLVPDLPVRSSIGLNFVSRAKRAFRAGRTWADFEQEELAIDSMSGVRAIEDPYEREIAAEYALDNDLRLYVFNQIKVRLCHEIWLQEYPEREQADDPKRDSVVNTAAATPSSYPPSNMETPATAATFTKPGDEENNGSRPNKQQRIQPDLPGDRELHQPEGPPIRATSRNMRGLNGPRIAWREVLAKNERDMATSSEAEDG